MNGVAMRALLFSHEGTKARRHEGTNLEASFGPLQLGGSRIRSLTEEMEFPRHSRSQIEFGNEKKNAKKAALKKRIPALFPICLASSLRAFVPSCLRVNSLVSRKAAKPQRPSNREFSPVFAPWRLCVRFFSFASAPINTILNEDHRS